MIPNRDYDAVVIGGRCAGAATAMLLARGGLQTLVVERGRRGSDTLSTHALMRGAVIQLQRWGLLDRVAALGTPPVRQATFHYGDEAVEVPVKPRDGVDGLYAPRRVLLDDLLVGAAIESGADVVHGTRLVGLAWSPTGRVTGVDLQDPDGETRRIGARVVIGADGLRSTVARLVGAPAYRVARHACAVVYGYWPGLAIDGYHFYYRPGVSAGAIPTNDGEACVFTATPPERFAREILPNLAVGHIKVLGEAAPGLADRVRGTAAAGTLRPFAGVRGMFRQSWGPGWALVGDAGYFKDPITAHGITDAFRDAELLARALLDGSERALASYQATRDDLALGFFEATDHVASFEWDYASLQRTHRRASEEMAREIAAMLEGFDAPIGASLVASLVATEPRP